VGLLMVGAGAYYLLAPRPATVTAAAAPVPPPPPAAAPAAPAAETQAVATPASPPPFIETGVANQATPAAQPSGEAEEAVLHLATTDRQRLQVALSALGFDTRGSDGVLGPRSREMIAAWQKARNHPETGYLTAAESQALLREAQSALQRFEEDKKKPVAPSRRQPASASPPAPRTEFFP
jgi:peptidoglycan hydrolase-like protein with peptidoglycan-binding domain